MNLQILKLNAYYYSDVLLFLGVPPMRPLWYEFPKDELTFGREGTHMLGEALLVTPVLQKSTTQGRIFLRHLCAQNCEIAAEKKI
jgi:hypothetical protein